MEKVNYQFFHDNETFPIMFQLIIQFNVNHCLKLTKKKCICLLSKYFVRYVADCILWTFFCVENQCGWLFATSINCMYRMQN